MTSSPFSLGACRPARATIAAVALGVFLGSTGVRAQPTLVKVLDSGDPVPGAPGASWASFRPFNDVVLDGDDIAFIGAANELSGALDGVYLRRGGTLQVVADSHTIRPGTGVPFGGGFWRAAMDGGTLAFVNEERIAMRGGVYRHGDAGLQVIADHTTLIPGGEPNHFLSFGDVAVHQGQVLFGGGTHFYFAVWHQDGLYRSAGGALTRLVDATTLLPGGSSSPPLVGEIGVDAFGFAFAIPRHNSTAFDGIYEDVGTGLQKVADLSIIAPHSGTPFQSINVFDYDNGVVAFAGDAGNQTALYLHDGQLRLIASRQTPFPGTGLNFAGFFNRLATSKGRVAVLGFRNPPGQDSKPGLILAGTDGKLTLIVDEGGVLDGQVVTDIDLSQGAFDWPHLAFTVGFADGSSALYRYTAVEEDPAPPAGPWLTSPELPGFQVKARFTVSGGTLAGQSVTPCIGETLCVSGAIPDRAELFVRVVGPRPNGKLWPTLVKFSTSRIEVWIEQTGSGVVRYYELREVTPGEQLISLDGLADKLGFDP